MTTVRMKAMGMRVVKAMDEKDRRALSNNCIPIITAPGASRPTLKPLPTDSMRGGKRDIGYIVLRLYISYLTSSLKNPPKLNRIPDLHLGGFDGFALLPHLHSIKVR